MLTTLADRLTSPLPLPLGAIEAHRALGPSALGDGLFPMGVVTRFARNTEIFGEDEEAASLYRVVSGAVRVSKLLSDGRRQVSAFHFAGDVFGLEASDVHQFCAEAIVESQILTVKRRAAMELGERDQSVGRQLWSIAIRDLARAQDHMMVLGRKTACERVAAFLLEMAARAGKGGSRVELPMSRYDIADYLGLTIETVSRTLTELESSGAIVLRSARSLDLCRKSALESIGS